MASFTLKKAKVAFCSVTSENGFKNGKHLLGVYVDKKFKKEVAKNFNAIWEENKTAKAKKPVYDMEDWFSTNDDGDLIFWVNKAVNSKVPITFKMCDTCNFKGEDFGVIGDGSTIDLEYDIYYHNDKTYGEMVLRSIKAILLRELVKYEGGDNLGGKSVDVGTTKPSDDEDADEPVEKESKKDKKKKKKKKNKN
jgi:hypothetical protein